MKKALFFILFLLVFLKIAPNAYASSPTYDWTKVNPPSGGNYGTSTTTDLSGNVYATGYFQGTVNFDPIGTDNHTAKSTSDIF